MVLIITKAIVDTLWICEVDAVAELDSVALSKSCVDFECVHRRRSRHVAAAQQLVARLHRLYINDRLVCCYEKNIQRHERVFHPEAAILLVVENKQHAGVLRKHGSAHEAALLLHSVVSNFYRQHDSGVRVYSELPRGCADTSCDEDGQQ